MAFPEDLLEPMIKGALVLAALAAGLAVIGFLALCVAPFAVGVALSEFAYFRRKREAIARQTREEELAIEREAEARKRLLAEQARQRALESELFWQERQAGQKRQKEAQREELEPTLDEDYYLESGLSFKQREELFARGFKRLKTSTDGRSGAAFYWVFKRFNESAEHAFFVYYIAGMLKKRGVKQVTLHVSSGPDVEFEFKRRLYCFEVETGSNLARNPAYVFKKLARNQQTYHKCFVFITRRKLKYRYSKLAEVVTRASLKATIAKLGAR